MERLEDLFAHIILADDQPSVKINGAVIILQGAGFNPWLALWISPSTIHYYGKKINVSIINK